MKDLRSDSVEALVYVWINKILDDLRHKLKCNEISPDKAAKVWKVKRACYECYYKRPDHQAVFVEGHDYSRCKHKDVQELVIPKKDVVEFFKDRTFFAKYHDKVQRLCDLWVSHIEAVDHQLENPYYFQLARLTREEKTEFATILKDLLDEGVSERSSVEGQK